MVEKPLDGNGWHWYSQFSYSEVIDFVISYVQDLQAEIKSHVYVSKDAAESVVEIFADISIIAQVLVGNKILVEPLVILQVFPKEKWI